MNPDLTSFGKFTFVTYTIPTVLMMFKSFKIGPMLLVIAAVLLGIILPMRIAVTMLPVTIVEACLLMTMPFIPFLIGGTSVRAMSWLGQ